MPPRSPDDTRPTPSPKEEVTTLSEPQPDIRRFKLCCYYRLLSLPQKSLGYGEKVIKNSNSPTCCLPAV
jgi:hypothetical protein